jgi:hypothetical protein
MQILFRSICGISPVHFTAVYEIITIIFGEIINVFHTPDPCYFLLRASIFHSGAWGDVVVKALRH